MVSISSSPPAPSLHIQGRIPPCLLCQSLLQETQLCKETEPPVRETRACLINTLLKGRESIYANSPTARSTDVATSPSQILPLLPAGKKENPVTPAATPNFGASYGKVSHAYNTSTSKVPEEPKALDLSKQRSHRREFAGTEAENNHIF
jgi:hypothetical protein